MFWFAKEKKQKILPLADMEFRAWPEQNFLFSILLGQKTGLEWMMNQFIQLRGAHYIDYSRKVADMSITFYPYAIHQLSPNMFDFCPFIRKYALPRQLVKGNYAAFHEFIRIAIDAGMYLSTFLDQFFREDISGNYGFHHPNFIYGYDDKTYQVLIADNFEKGIYGKKAITYEELDRAFDLVPEECWEISVFLYQIVEYDHTFQSQYVREQIGDYLTPGKGVCYFNRTVCTTPSFRNRIYSNEVFFGVECYDLLQRYLQAILQNDEEYADKDIRSFVMLHDHKKMMIKRYEFMLEHGYLEGDDKLYHKLLSLGKECEILQNMFLKYKITDDSLYIERMAERLKRIRSMDIRCMECFAEKLME